MTRDQMTLTMIRSLLSDDDFDMSDDEAVRTAMQLIRGLLGNKAGAVGNGDLSKTGEGK